MKAFQTVFSGAAALFFVASGCVSPVSGGSVKTISQENTPGPAPSVVPPPVPSPTARPSPAVTPTPTPTPIPTATGPGVTTLRPLGTTAAPYGYAEYLPAGYSASGKYPLMVMLHGAGEVGNGTSDLPKVRFNGPNNQIDNHGLKLPMVVISPQTSIGSWGEDGGNSTRLDQFLTYLLQTYAVDAKRVYFTGLSLGGGGVWSYAARHPERVAAIVPICGFDGYASTAYGAGIVGQGVAVWAAHAVDDTTVGIQYTLNWMGVLAQAHGILNKTFDSIQLGAPDGYSTVGTVTFAMDPVGKNWLKYPGQSYKTPAGTDINPKQFVTFYQSGGHGIWERMYADPLVYEWMLKQSR